MNTRFLLPTLAVFLLMAASSAHAADDSKEVTENPAILLNPKVKVTDLTVYGVKLGDPIEKIPDKAAAAKKPSDNNLQITYCIGRDVAYVAHNGKIVQIAIGGDLAAQLPPCDATRLQITLGKADEIDHEPDNDRDTYVSFISRQLRAVIHDNHGIQARIVLVTLYAP